LKSTKVGVSVMRKLDCYIDINNITTEMIKTQKKDFEAIARDILNKNSNKWWKCDFDENNLNLKFIALFT